MDKPIVLTSEDACPECKGYNQSMQTNPVHDPVRHYQCHDCGHSWDVQPNKGIVLTGEERDVLESVVLMLRANLTEYTPPLQRGAIQKAVTTINHLLARSGATENTDGSALRNK